MGKKQLLFLIIGVMCLVLGLKVFLLKSGNDDVSLSQMKAEKAVAVSPEIAVLQDKINNEALPFEERTQAIETMANGFDRDLAITTLEKIEEKQKTTAIGDYLRRTVIKLRFNK